VRKHLWASRLSLFLPSVSALGLIDRDNPRLAGLGLATVVALAVVRLLGRGVAWRAYSRRAAKGVGSKASLRPAVMPVRQIFQLT